MYKDINTHTLTHEKHALWEHKISAKWDAHTDTQTHPHTHTHTHTHTHFTHTHTRKQTRNHTQDTHTHIHTDTARTYSRPDNYQKEFKHELDDAGPPKLLICFTFSPPSYISTSQSGHKSSHSP